MANILLCDHQQLTYKGLSNIITSAQIGNQVGYANLDEQLIDIITHQNISLLIADPYSVTNGADCLEQVKAAFPDLKFMIISNSIQRTDIRKFLNLGIRCYISKKATVNEIIAAVKAALQQEKYFCGEVSQQFYSGIQTDAGQLNLPDLSAREKEIIHLIAEGLPDKDIAERLFLSFHTIRTHRKNITKKLGFNLKNAAELVLVINYLNESI